MVCALASRCVALHRSHLRLKESSVGAESLVCAVTCEAPSQPRAPRIEYAWMTLAV